MFTWLWNIRHRRLIEETRRLINFKIFLEQEVGIKYNFTVQELKAGLKALPQKQ
jgi:hypothetical protein